VTELLLPELGENIAAGDVVRVLVHVGDRVARDQPVLELETDKATIEVPSSLTGTISEVRVKPSDKVKVGQVILVVDEAGAEAASAPAAEAKPDAKPEAPAAPPAPTHASEAAVEGGLAQDVHGTPSTTGAPHARGQQEREQGLGQVAPQEAGGRPGRIVDIAAGRPAPTSNASVPAAPSTRRYARELGLDIGQVPGTGPGGRVSMDDVKAQARTVITGSGGRAHVVTSVPLPDFSKWGAVERQPMRAVRRKTAEHMARAWATVPHVTQGDKADITNLEGLRQKYGKRVEAGGGKLTVTAIALKVVASALKVFPQFNASIDVDNEQVVYKKFVNIGVAVDTEFGLLVPVLRDVDQKNIIQISAELAQLADKAKARKLTLEDMEGGCFTVSNLGGIGGTYFTPIVNVPEVAILGMSRSVVEPVFVDGAFQPRTMMPLSLSYDHRLIDGADAIRFLRWVCDALEQPFVMALQG
jgi:pyruvate dehydrogenase E2 component (dihydrolipoamide acetyltransferase)